MSAAIKKNVDEIIRRMAKLARLKFPDKELPHYAAKAEAILRYIEQLGELDTKGIEPMSHAVETKGAALRPDEVIPSELAAALLALAPEQDDHFVQVPKVLDV